MKNGRVQIIMISERDSFNAVTARDENLVGKKLLEARKTLNLTQPELCARLERLGVTIQPAAVAKWENGSTTPNPYQFFALCYALEIKDGFEYFTGSSFTGKDTLNAEGRRTLNAFHDFLMTQEQYTFQRKPRMVTMKISLNKASAGSGDYLDDDNFELRDFPASSVPYGADFGVIIDGDSMEPEYHNGQVAWISVCDHLEDGDVGLFTYDGDGYIKVYRETEPDDPDDFTDSDGAVHPQIVLESINEKYNDKIINPEYTFTIIGKVLN